MKEHLKRRIENSKDLMPEEGTLEYDAVINQLKKHEENNPNFRKSILKKKAETLKIWELQSANGIGLFMDPEIRHYLGEFNHRSAKSPDFALFIILKIFLLISYF